MTGNPTPPPSDEEPLVHVGWWCWRGDNHGHLATTACRSDNVPLHVPAEWADEMRAVIQRIEDGDEDEAPAVPVPPTTHAGDRAAVEAERDSLGREADRLRKDWVEMRTRAERAEAERDAYGEQLDEAAETIAARGVEINRLTDELRRMADEAQQQAPTPAAHHAPVPAGTVCKCPGDCGHRPAAEAQQQPACAECDHPQDTHREGEDPVSPGRCTVCPGSGEEWHDFQPVPGLGRVADEGRES